MPRVYVGNLDPRATERDLEDEFRVFGNLRSVWVARKPPGFAFLDFEDTRDAEDAVKKMDGVRGWRVEFSRGGARGDGGGRDMGRDGGYGDRDRGGGGGRGGGLGGDMRCYECGEIGHLARDCRIRQARLRGSPVRGRSRSRSRSRRRSPSRSRSRSPARRSVSRSPVRRRSPSYSRSRSRSRR